MPSVSTPEKPRLPILLRLARRSARLEAHLSHSAFKHLLRLIYLSVLGVAFFWGLHAQLQRSTKPASARIFFAVSRGASRSLLFSMVATLILSARTLVARLKEAPPVAILGLDAPYPSLHRLTGWTTVLISAVHVVSGIVAQVVYVGKRESGIWGFKANIASGAVLTVLVAALAVAGHLSHSTVTGLETDADESPDAVVEEGPGSRYPSARVAHLVLAVLCIGLAIVHGKDVRAPIAARWVAPALVITLLDFIYRYLRTSRLRIPASEIQLKQLDDDTAILSFPRPCSFFPGQYFRISLSGNKLDGTKVWPVSAPAEGAMLILLQDNALIAAVQGEIVSANAQAATNVSTPTDTTETVLAHMNQTVTAPDSVSTAGVLLTGPFGTPSRYGKTFEHSVLIATNRRELAPFVSVAKHVLHTPLNPGAASADQGTEPEHYTALQAAVSTAVTRRYMLPGYENIPENGPIHEDPEALHSDIQRFSEAQAAELEGTVADYVNNTVPTIVRDHAAAIVDTVEHGLSGAKAVKAPTEQIDNVGTTVSTRDRAAPMTDGNRLDKLISRLSDWRLFLLHALHSTKAEFVNTVLTLSRYDISFVNIIIGGAAARAAGISKVGAVLSGLVAASVIKVVLLELSVLKSRFFSDRGRWVDLCVLLPVVIITFAFSTWDARTNETLEKSQKRARFALQMAVFIPLKLVLLIYRLHRSIGVRNAFRQREWELALLKEDDVDAEAEEEESRETRGAAEKRIDLLWYNRESDNDEAWLRLELAEYESDERLRLTSLNHETDDHMGNIEKKVEEVLQSIASRSPSNTQVGVYVVGNDKKMEFVTAAIRRVEIASHLRGRYLYSHHDVLREDFKTCEHGFLHGLRQTGCHVRFVARHESFS